jgi:hypothetical protein
LCLSGSAGVFPGGGLEGMEGYRLRDYIGIRVSHLGVFREESSG